MPKTAPKKASARAISPPSPKKTTIVVTLYGGTRELIENKDFLIRIFDGFQNKLFDNYRPAPTTVFHPTGTIFRTSASSLPPVTAMWTRVSIP